MSIERSYDVITLPKGRKIVKIKFDDPYYELLGTFFFSDYRSFGDWIDEKIDIVVNGEEEMQDISGNICEIVIKKDTVILYDMLADDGKGKWCELPTSEFIEIIKEWREKTAS